MDETCHYQGITFVWNRQKALANRIKHGVSFERACEAFFDPFLCLVDASREGDERDAVIGEDVAGRLLFVVHVQQIGEIFRLISARKATGEEREHYENQ
ncbi:MAG: BrnT family toxin [Magnetococcales bacterium]|nr:BrnT family toxin [Magnetococcales bacterium]